MAHWLVSCNCFIIELLSVPIMVLDFIWCFTLDSLFLSVIIPVLNNLFPNSMSGLVFAYVNITINLPLSVNVTALPSITVLNSFTIFLLSVNSLITSIFAVLDRFTSSINRIL